MISSCKDLMSFSCFDQKIESHIGPFADLLSSVIFYKLRIQNTEIPVVVLWLLSGCIFSTIYFGFVNFRHFFLSLRILRGDYSNPNEPGEVSHFQALCTALSGTIGIGNIGAVAVAVTVGGPGASFWMILAGILGMSCKFAECMLAVMFRRENANGSFSGGPMYYLSRGFDKIKWPRLGSFLGNVYAIGIVFGCLGIGNMFQSNQAFMQIVQVTGGMEASWFADKGWLIGIIIALTVGSVIMGGIQSIAAVTAKLVPFMGAFYLFLALFVIGLNIEYLPQAIWAIFEGAFDPIGVKGGILGGMIIGIQRAVFSNEAGIGSAAIAHSAVRTNHPATEGLVAMIEPFVDTIIICTVTGILIGITQISSPGYLTQLNVKGVTMTSAALGRQLPWTNIPFMIITVLFAISTIISWSYYGIKAWTFLLGEEKKTKNIFKVVFCGFSAIGCMVSLESVLKMSDALVFFICIPNIFGIFVLAPQVKSELKRFLQKIESGEIKNYSKDSL